MKAENRAAMNEGGDILVSKGWFTAFGIFQILLGSVLALVLLAILATATNSLNQGSAAFRTFYLLLVALTYTGLSALFISCGIGIMKPRRWAHRLMGIVSWIWLVCGAAGFVFALFAVSPVLRGALSEQGLPASAVSLAVALVFSISAVIYLVFPGSLSLFYSLRSVRRTVYRLDPLPSWVDACPPSVLGLSFLYAITSLTMLAVVPLGVFPFFGRAATGIAGSALFLMTAAICAWLAYGFYRLDAKAYWASVATTLIWGTSGVLTFAGGGFEGFYRAAGYTTESLALMRGYNLGPGTMAIFTALSVLAFLAYLWWVRRSFFPATEANS